MVSCMIKFYFRDKAQKLPIRVNARGFIINFVHITIVTVILRQNRARFWIERTRGRWDAENSNPDGTKFRSGSRDWRTLLCSGGSRGGAQGARPPLLLE